VDQFMMMESFIAVAHCGNVSAAARSLAISRALVSRHIMDLEKRIGAPLLQRTARSVRLTEAGSAYLEFCRRIVAQVAEQDAAMRSLRESAQGSLSVVSPKWIGSLDLGDAIAGFALCYPSIQMRLELGGLASERAFNFIERGYDIAFHTRSLRDSSITVRRVASLEFVLCASPDYFAHRDPPRTPADLFRHDCLLHVEDGIWRFGPESFKPRRIVFSSNTFLVLQKAAIRGLGLALLPERSAHLQLRSGQLQQVLRGFAIPERPLYVAFAPGRQRVRKVKLFVDFIAEWFKRYPPPGAPRLPAPH
jgi:DNA-binding transcriptional LysR family regulator